MPSDTEKSVTEFVQGYTPLMCTVEWCQAFTQEGGKRRRIFKLVNLINSLTADESFLRQ